MHYFLRRLLLLLPLLWLVTLLAFLLINLAPVDPAVAALRLNDVTLTDEIIAQTRAELGLDLPFWQRYATWLFHLAQFDLGRSFVNNQPVLGEIATAVPITLRLTGLALLFIFLLSLGGALLCVLFPNGWLDRTIRGVLFVLTAIPHYWLALLLLWWLAVQHSLFPVGGIDGVRSYLLPAFTLSLGYVGIYLRLIRGAMLAQASQSYVFYAKARGLSSRRILLRHILPNALHSSLTGIGMSIPKLLAGSVVIENIFALPGVGRLCIQAIFARDYPMIQAYILMMALLFLSFNFAVDLLLHYTAPHLRTRENG